MKNLYFIEYGCSQCTEHLIVEAKDAAAAEYYAYTSAQDCYFGYDCNYIDPEDYPDATEEELVEIENEEMELDIHYLAEEFDESNEEHIETLREQDNKPFEV